MKKMKYLVRIYGPASGWENYRYEIDSTVSDATICVGVAATQEEAKIEAQRYIEALNPQPLEEYFVIVGE